MYQLTGDALIITIIEFITNGFICYYTWVQLRLAYLSVRKSGSLGPWASDVWNMLECVVLGAFYISTYLRLTLYASLKPAPVIFEDYFTDFFTIGKLWLETFNLDAMCVVVLFFKLLKYAQLYPATAMLMSVLTRAGKDMGYFIIMLVLLMVAFAMMAMQVRLQTYHVLHVRTD